MSAAKVVRQVSVEEAKALLDAWRGSSWTCCPMRRTARSDLPGAAFRRRLRRPRR